LQKKISKTTSIDVGTAYFPPLVVAEPDPIPLVPAELPVVAVPTPWLALVALAAGLSAPVGVVLLVPMPMLLPVVPAPSVLPAGPVPTLMPVAVPTLLPVAPVPSVLPVTPGLIVPVVLVPAFIPVPAPVPCAPLPKKSCSVRPGT